jgi:translation initiation factor 1A
MPKAGLQVPRERDIQRADALVQEPLRSLLFSSEENELGKRKVLNEAHLKELVLPEQGELLGRVQKVSGGNQVLVQCTDGEVRLCRIRGKMKRRMWIREGDIVLISPWDFDHKRADIVWRYIKDHADWLENNGYMRPTGPAAAQATQAPTPAPQAAEPTAPPPQA